MKKKNLETLLENILKLEDLISEAIPVTLPTNSSTEAEPNVSVDSSLDAVVDRYIVRYEKESIPTVETYDEETFSGGTEVPTYSEPTPMGEEKMKSGRLFTEKEARDAFGKGIKNNLNETLNYVLNEADDDKEELDLNADENADEANEQPPADDSFSPDDTNVEAEQAPPEGAPIMQTPQINLNDFAMAVARLVNNFDTLLNPKEVLLNRVENYIKMNYDNRTAKELMDILDQNYSLRTSGKEDYEENEIPTSYSVGALSTEG